MIACPNCRTIVPVQFANTGAVHKCHNCLTRLRTELFNAFHRPMEQGQSGDEVQERGEAECFYHPGKKAVAPCSACGRLLCALCEIPFDDRTICTGCLQSGRNKKEIKSLEKSRFLYDSLALNLAFWPLITFFFFIFWIFTAPVSIFIVLRYWRTPTSLLPRTKFRYVLALLLAVVGLVGWVMIVMAMFH